MSDGSELNKVSIASKLSKIDEYWNPYKVGELNGQYVKLAKLLGEFVWHQHENEDELFLVIKGTLKMELPDKIVEVQEGEFIIIPKGVTHRPVALEEVHILLFEPSSTINTGNIVNEFTRLSLITI